jgi:hypothetical protein
LAGSDVPQAEDHSDGLPGGLAMQHHHDFPPLCKERLRLSLVRLRDQ